VDFILSILIIKSITTISIAKLMCFGLNVCL